MKIYVMTDLEGVAGVMDTEHWTAPGKRYYDKAKELLTKEVNAAVDGFFLAGAEEIVVADGHGPGGINSCLLDRRVRLMRGWPTGWPLLLDSSYDAVAWVGQHAKAGTEKAHLAHTQSFAYLDLAVNGISIGEFGQFALCASELGIPSIFASGDLALTCEAEEHIPAIETVAVKEGTTPGTGDELTVEEYARRNSAVIHLHPEEARERIKESAIRSLHRLKKGSLEIRKLDPPYTRTAAFRPKTQGDPITVAREKHPDSISELLNMTFKHREFQGEWDRERYGDT